jgi:hypothetical protein
VNHLSLLNHYFNERGIFELPDHSNEIKRRAMIREEQMPESAGQELFRKWITDIEELIFGLT